MSGPGPVPQLPGTAGDPSIQQGLELFAGSGQPGAKFADVIAANTGLTADQKAAALGSPQPGVNLTQLAKGYQDYMRQHPDTKAPPNLIGDAITVMNNPNTDAATKATIQRAFTNMAASFAETPPGLNRTGVMQIVGAIYPAVKELNTADVQKAMMIVTTEPNNPAAAALKSDLAALQAVTQPQIWSLDVTSLSQLPQATQDKIATIQGWIAKDLPPG